MLKYILISFLIITNAHAYTCEEMGYTKTIADCPNGGLKCPAQPEKMFCCDRCGDGSGYLYNESNCSPDDGLQLAGIECGGKWTKCEHCTSEYKYNKDNCRSPKILAGVQCANSYTQCVYPSGIGCVPTVGYIYYADGSCHAEYDDTKTPVGIIVDASKKIIVALEEKGNIPWNDGTNTYYDIPELKNCNSASAALLDMDGKSNTDKIISFSLSSGQPHMAAQYCADKKEGNKKWYLPSIGELYQLVDKMEDIQITLSEIPYANNFSLGKYYWASTEYTATKPRLYRYDNNLVSDAPKSSISYLTRCFAHF